MMPDISAQQLQGQSEKHKNIIKLLMAGNKTRGDPPLSKHAIVKITTVINIYVDLPTTLSVDNTSMSGTVNYEVM